MEEMKAYTDLEQSKKLAEILPLESADMCWMQIYDENHMMSDHRIGIIPFRFYSGIGVPCWSLAALLEIIKKLVGYSLQSLDTHTVFMNCELGDKPYNVETKNYDNPIDACYEMILKLHELNLL